MTSISPAASFGYSTQQQVLSNNNQPQTPVDNREQVQPPIAEIPENERPQLSPEEQRELIDQVEARRADIAQQEQNVQDAQRQAAVGVADYNQTQRVVDAYVTSASNGEADRDSNTISPSDIQVTETQYRVATDNVTPAYLYSQTEQGSESNPTIGQIIDNQV
ncbi:hypothetical protein K0504_02980 [Neiella marina]|uniref:Uncharacterized protein n=1 Tax=Neiella holothuriorum TaxID=2870530 RepID=A0ABS7EDT7_9GAMM|nr:hypothetical protein [Neiella holothuriorum]MBW8189986.1 hypothetical protein [Neiella holothuriorum]